MRRAFVRALASGWLVALGLCATPAEDFVLASREYYDYSAPMLRQYIENDPSLNDDDRRIRLMPIEEYRAILEEAERHE